MILTVFVHYDQHIIRVWYLLNHHTHFTLMVDTGEICYEKANNYIESGLCNYRKYYRSYVICYLPLEMLFSDIL